MWTLVCFTPAPRRLLLAGAARVDPVLPTTGSSRSRLSAREEITRLAPWPLGLASTKTGRGRPPRGTQSHGSRESQRSAEAGALFRAAAEDVLARLGVRPSCCWRWRSKGHRRVVENLHAPGRHVAPDHGYKAAPAADHRRTGTVCHFDHRKRVADEPAIPPQSPRRHPALGWPRVLSTLLTQPTV